MKRRAKIYCLAASALFVLVVGAAVISRTAAFDAREKKAIEDLVLDYRFEEALARTEEVIEGHPDTLWPHLSKAFILGPDS